MMRTRFMALAVLVLLGSGSAPAQEKSPAAAPTEVPVKVQIVLSEFNGTQKISSLPYSLNMLATGPRDRHFVYLRLGVRVPISTSSNQITYQDVGTNIDGAATLNGNDEYRLDFTVDRSSVTVPDKGTDWKPGQSYSTTAPLIRSFRDDFKVIVKNGQTIEGTSAVDPVTGHVLKVDVTLTVLK